MKVINISEIFEVPNINAKDADLKKIIYKIPDLMLINNNYFPGSEYLCVCSGGTTSSCAKENLITLDLRKNYNYIKYNPQKKIVKIGGGVLMGSLLDELEKHGRIFPTGLSSLPGVGFILTGGISPLSRRYGLAIDNIDSVKGYLGNGEYFAISKKEIKREEIDLWEAIKGAAPFLSIITEIGLKTFESSPILICEGFVDDNEFKEIITLAEMFPPNQSLQWMHSERKYIYIVCELKTAKDKIHNENLLNKIKGFKALKHKILKSFNQAIFFPKELKLFELNQTNHSEVISLLGCSIENRIYEFTKLMEEINENRPNKSCYVACQQLGSSTNLKKNYEDYFIHRDSIWKPWIYTSWKKNDLKDKELAINWLIKSWIKLKKFFPHIHLAQLHNHLDFHQEEIELAFGKKLNKLKLLKNIYDPMGNLPPL